MGSLCIGLSFTSPPSYSSTFRTVACEASEKHWRKTPKSQEYQRHLKGRLSSVEFLREYENKVESIKKLLIKAKEEEDGVESLKLVDAVQRLGVASHYQDEIHTILDLYYAQNRGCYSLHDAALSFRLLRQRGYIVSPDVFSNFKDKDGAFKGQLRQDIRGLLELYEATQLRFEGEHILDEAEDFSSQLLYESLDDHNIVNMRLRYPYHRSIKRFLENSFVRDLHCINGWVKPLTQLAEMDFVIGQSIHKQELLQVTKWWEELGLTRELQLVRNQPLKWYTWSMAILIDDISLTVQRVELTKSIAFIYVIDDIFDLYGTLDELAVFTQAVNKWDYAAMDMLPDYMKMCYKALLDTTNEISHMICQKHGRNPINSFKQAWGNLCNAFLVEAKWLTSRELPIAEEYLANAKVSSGVHVALVHLLFLLGLDENHLNDASRLMSCVAAILRLWDDLGSAKDEHQNGRDGSYIECYMKDHRSLSLKQAREHAMSMILLEWKHLNEECSRVYSSSGLHFVEGSLNLARMVSLMYSYDDNQHLVLDQYISLMLLNCPSCDCHPAEQEYVV